MHVKKIEFFKRIKKSVFNFEEYEKFIEEPIQKAFGYFFKLIALFSLIVTIALVYTINVNINNIETVIKDDKFPQFKIENNILDMNGQETYEHYFDDYNFQLIISEENTENIEDYDNCLVFLREKMIIKYNGYTEELGYNNMEGFSNETLINFFNTKEWKILCINIFIMMILLNFILYATTIFLDVITLSILGLIMNIFIKIKIRYQDLLKISLYALTLPIILYLLYNTTNILFGITIKYFQVAYATISYIYLITVMLMMKVDITKNTQELQRIIEEQKNVKDELEKERQKEEEEKKEEEKKEKEKKQKKGKDNKDKTPQEPQTDNG